MLRIGEPLRHFQASAALRNRRLIIARDDTEEALVYRLSRIARVSPDQHLLDNRLAFGNCNCHRRLGRRRLLEVLHVLLECSNLVTYCFLEERIALLLFEAKGAFGENLREEAVLLLTKLRPVWRCF